MLYARFPEIRNDDRDHAHYLDPQNRARAEVGSPAIVWDAELQAQAERLAEYLAQKEGCAVRRMKEVSGGVNLRWAAESWGVPAEAESAVAEWVREKAHYRLEAFPAGCAEGRDCTHYTQVVWKKTERVGCGTAMCNEGGAVWACPGTTSAGATSLAHEQWAHHVVVLVLEDVAVPHIPRALRWVE
ncbi:unnamed protein product [Closterium sp. NIES-65]|nr:unnamed protein product [Closterium sp. NIES-65]